MSDSDELEDSRQLNNLFADVSDSDVPVVRLKDSASIKNKEEIDKKGSYIQWTTMDKKDYFPAGNTCAKLNPGYYELVISQTSGLFFSRINVKTEGIIRFPQTNADKILLEIQNFWSKESEFDYFGLTYKRGAILYGPPGSGKTSVIQLISKDVIERGGVIIKFSEPNIFLAGYRILREIQPDVPIVVLMEDIDCIISRYGEHDVLNILDGVDNVRKVVFIATTNYPENLGPRIINRPSRFDRRSKIGHPNAESREIYLRHLMKDDIKVDLNRWIKDTEGFSLAHLKELFISVCIMEYDYEKTVKTLALMRENISSEDDDVKMGFHKH